jgi:hypothetical protein
MLSKKQAISLALALSVVVVGLGVFFNKTSNKSGNDSQSLVSPDSKPKEEVNSAESIKLNQAAALLAGKVLPETTLPENLKGNDWNAFAALTQSNWAQYSKAIGEPMKVWSATEVKTDQKTIFYPFSGPDFTTLYQLFPNQDHYIMSALQPAEKLIDLGALSPKSANQTLEVLSSAWKSFGHDGFFVTEYLYKYLSTNNVRIGATSLIATFLHLQNFSIQKIVPIQVNEQGVIEELKDEDRWYSVRFYLKKDGRPVVLDYVRMDLSDQGFKDSPGNAIFFKESSKNPVVFKAASHLPQHGHFTFVAKTVTETAPMIVQDETGIGYGKLNQYYETTLYGEFVKSYKVFSSFNRELAAAYKERSDEKPLPFRVGYFKDGTYAMIVAKRKSN